MMPDTQDQSSSDTLDEQSQRARSLLLAPRTRIAKDWAATPIDATLFSLPKQAFKMRFKQRFARTPGDIFNPPAPSFNRRPAGQWAYQAFLPVSIKANGRAARLMGSSLCIQEESWLIMTRRPLTGLDS